MRWAKSWVSEKEKKGRFCCGMVLERRESAWLVIRVVDDFHYSSKNLGLRGALKEGFHDLIVLLG
jgi:hypothetical protein